jgi:hypothetical protein
MWIYWFGRRTAAAAEAQATNPERDTIAMIEASADDLDSSGRVLSRCPASARVRNTTMLPPGTHQIALTLSAIAAIFAEPSLLYNDLVRFGLIVLTFDWAYTANAFWKARRSAFSPVPAPAQLQHHPSAATL